MAQVLVGQPFDTIKTRLQVAAPSQFRGALDCLSKTVRTEGLLAVYKGLLPPLLGIGAVNALLFASYTRLQKLQRVPGQELTLTQIALAGAGAGKFVLFSVVTAVGAVNTVLASPVELLKIRLQTQATQQPRLFAAPMHEVFRCYRSVVQQGGYCGLLLGFQATLLREMPAYAAFYATFEASKRWVRRAQAIPGSQQLPLLWLMGCGAASGVAYWLSCYPLDVAKSRIQSRPSFSHPPSTASVLRDLYRQQGLAGWFQGFTPCLLRSLPAAAATFTTFELASAALKPS